MQVGHLSYTKPRHCSSRQFSLVCAQFSLEWCRYSAVCYGWTRIENAAYMEIGERRKCSGSSVHPVHVSIHLSVTGWNYIETAETVI